METTEQSVLSMPKQNLTGIQLNMWMLLCQVGGATAHIGDPSGKTKDREQISAEIVEQNILGLTENLERIFTNHAVFLWKDQRDLKDPKYEYNLSVILSKIVLYILFLFKND